MAKDTSISLNFKELPDEEKLRMANLMLSPLSSAKELKNWVHTFLGLDMPIGHVDPDSNSSPVDAMWEIYSAIKENRGEDSPGYIMLSAREGYKTLSSSILETLIMIHFQLTIAHMAAIKDQSAKSIQYINLFFSKIDPLLEIKGWVNRSQNKTRIEYRSPEGEDVYILIVVATLSGANSAHTNLMFIDEIDVVKDPLAYEEAKLIPGFAKGVYPITVKLSTRKFAFGLMQKEIDNAPISGDKILRWNIIDVAEYCPPSRHKPDLPKQDRYISKSLPLNHISSQEYAELSDIDRGKYEYLQDAHAGCVNCKLLSVCKKRLADNRAPVDKKGLYKPIGSVINTFRKIEPDMAEAQLMCWKPSSKGLVYPRFEGTPNTGNTITLDAAFEALTGAVRKNIKQDELVILMRSLGISFYAGVDWGYDHEFAICIFAKIPNGEFWIVDSYGAPGLEFSDQLEKAKFYRDKYQPEKWFADTNMPANRKGFTRNGMRAPDFTKDVMGGIEALRSKIVDGYGRRLLKVLRIPETTKVIDAITKHHFKLDAAGNPTITPDDQHIIADMADALRYVAQNLFPVKGTQRVESTWTEFKKDGPKSGLNEDMMREEISKRIGEAPMGITSGKKNGFHFTF